MRSRRQGIQDLKMVMIIWRDCVSYDPWDSMDEHRNRNLHEIKSIGFLVSKTKESLVIVQNIDLESADASMSMSIPMLMVKSIKEIK